MGHTAQLTVDTCVWITSSDTPALSCLPQTNTLEPLQRYLLPAASVIVAMCGLQELDEAC